MATPLRSPPIGFAHRGASADAPENTLPAFALALERGATGLESDAWLTADGVVVLDHDGEIDGRPIGTFRRAELPRHIPSLRELYEELGNDYELSLDIKEDTAGPSVIEVADDAGDPSRLWLCHWNWKVVAQWRERSPAVRLVDSTRAKHMRTTGTARAERMAALGIDAINLHESDWTEELVATFHECNRFALGWDAQDEQTLGRLVALGVDGVYSDHVNRMMTSLEPAS